MDKIERKGYELTHYEFPDGEDYLAHRWKLSGNFNFEDKTIEEDFIEAMRKAFEIVTGELIGIEIIEEEKAREDKLRDMIKSAP